MLLQCDGKKSDDKNGFPEAPGSGTLQYFQLLEEMNFIEMYFETLMILK